MSKKKPNDGESARFKIMYLLMKKKEPMTCQEIAKSTNLTKQRIMYNLKILTKFFLIAEVENKKYICQPFLFDEEIKDDLDSLMKVIVKTINKEIDLPENCSEYERTEAVIVSLETYIRAFTVDLLE